MTKRYEIALLVTLVLIVLCVMIYAGYGFSFGFFVSVMNLAVSTLMIHNETNKVQRFVGGSLSIVIKSFVIRVVIVSCMLLWGFKNLDGGVSFDLVLGFALGQVVFIINNLFRIVGYGK